MAASATFEKHSFSLIRNDFLLEESVTMVSIKPRLKKIDLAKAQDQILILERFLNVKDSQALVKYANCYGLPHKNEQAIIHQMDTNLVRPGLEMQIIWEPNYFLNLAATLRWLGLLICTVQEMNHSSLDEWTKRSDAVTQTSLFAEFQPPEIRLAFRISKGCSEYSDWTRAQNILDRHVYCIPKENWRSPPLQRKARLAFAKAYLAYQLNRFVSQVHPAVTNDGEPTYKISTPFEAMCMNLLNQFSGAAGISICRNPNCPTRFYLARKNKRKQRSDRQYCGRPGCQKWGVENLGRVRKSYGEK